MVRGGYKQIHECVKESMLGMGSRKGKKICFHLWAKQPNSTSFGVNKNEACHTNPRSKGCKKEKKERGKNKERREIYKWLCFWTIKIYTFLKANLFFILSGFMWVILSCVTEMVPTLKDRQRVNWNALSNCHFCNRDEIWLSATHLELQYQYPDAILPKPQSH